MKKVGITGGIGCGKSTVVAEFAKLGVSAFVADSVAAAYYNDCSFLEEVKSLFGQEFFTTDGSVDKKRLAAKVFSDRQALANLNALVHPRVLRDFERFCSNHSDEPYVLFESAILYDYGFDRLMDAVIGVYLGMEERMQRLAVRDGASREELMARVANQMPAEEILRRADYVILNYEGNPRLRQAAYIDYQIKKKQR